MLSHVNHTVHTEYLPAARPRGYTTFFMLKSVVHEILNAYRYTNIKKFSFFVGSDKPRMLLLPAHRC